MGKNVRAINITGIARRRIAPAIRKKIIRLLFSGVRNFIKNKISLFYHISSLAITLEGILQTLGNVITLINSLHVTHCGIGEEIVLWFVFSSNLRLWLWFFEFSPCSLTTPNLLRTWFIHFQTFWSTCQIDFDILKVNLQFFNFFFSWLIPFWFINLTILEVLA